MKFGVIVAWGCGLITFLFLSAVITIRCRQGFLELGLGVEVN